MTSGWPDYDRYRAGRSGHNIPPARRDVHPLEFGRKAVSLGPLPLPPICAPDTCRIGGCDLTKTHPCRLMASPDKDEPTWPMAPRT